MGWADRSDHETLLAARRGDDAAARELWARFAPRLGALAAGLLRGCGREHAASDTVQTVMLAVLSAPGRDLAAIRDVPAFLCRCARHAALNQIREHQRRRRRERVAWSVVRGPETFDPARRDELHAGLDRLPAEAREILVLKHFGALTFDQLALVLDIPRGTASSRYRAALDQLRVLVAGRWPAEGSEAGTQEPQPVGQEGGDE